MASGDLDPSFAGEGPQVWVEWYDEEQSSITHTLTTSDGSSNSGNGGSGNSSVGAASDDHSSNAASAASTKKRWASPVQRGNQYSDPLRLASSPDLKRPAHSPRRRPGGRSLLNYNASSSAPDSPPSAAVSAASSSSSFSINATNAVPATRIFPLDFTDKHGTLVDVDLTEAAEKEQDSKEKTPKNGKVKETASKAKKGKAKEKKRRASKKRSDEGDKDEDGSGDDGDEDDEDEDGNDEDERLVAVEEAEAAAGWFPDPTAALRGRWAMWRRESAHQDAVRARCFSVVWAKVRGYAWWPALVASPQLVRNVSLVSPSVS